MPVFAKQGKQPQVAQIVNTVQIHSVATSCVDITPNTLNTVELVHYRERLIMYCSMETGADGMESQ